MYRKPQRLPSFMPVQKAVAHAAEETAIAAQRNVCCDGAVKAGRAADTAGPANMIWVPGGRFLMGSNNFDPEERPAFQASVQGFWIDAHPVTNSAFRQFVGATGYVTASERQPDAAAYPDADPSLLVPGSLVFRKPPGPVNLRDYRAWREYAPAANWRLMSSVCPSAFSCPGSVSECPTSSTVCPP